MKSRNTKTEFNTAPIHSAISKVINELSAVINNNNEVLNDVCKTIQPGADGALLATTLTSLVDAVIAEHKNNLVRISAHKHRDLIMLHISHTGPFNFSAISESLNKAQPFTEKMNGYIGVTTYLNNTTTIAFSFDSILKKA